MKDREFRNIALVGMMGSGKSAVGRSLAERLGWRFVDVDAEIVAAQGRSIADIFAQQGEPAFRDLETESLREAARMDHAVIATGGGAVLREENRDIIWSTSWVVWLIVDAEKAVQRVARGERRPVLERHADPAAAAQAILRQREPFYALADWHIDTQDHSVEDLAGLLERRWADLQA